MLNFFSAITAENIDKLLTALTILSVVAGAIIAGFSFVSPPVALAEEEEKNRGGT